VIGEGALGVEVFGNIEDQGAHSPGSGSYVAADPSLYEMG